MIKSFIKFKRKVRAQAIASAVMLGLAAGLVSVAALTVYSKLSGDALLLWHYLASGGGALLVAIGAYFLLMPSDKRLAKRLDALYTLEEKVATMVELRNDDSVFAQLQRENAEMHLGEKPTKLLRSKTLVAAIIVLCIAIGSMTVAWLIPPKTEPPEEPIDEFDKQWIITAINELIGIVENAYIDEDLKESSLTDLRSLLSFVEGSQLLSQMKTEAIKTVISLNGSLETANSAEAIAEQLVQSTNSEINALGKALGELSGTSSKKALESLGSVISKADASDASFIADELDVYLTRSGVRTDDEVYMLVKSMIAEAKVNPSGADDSAKALGKTLSTVIIVQNVNRSTMNNVIKTLCNVFGITEDDIAAVDPDVEIEIGDSEGETPPPEDAPVEDQEGNIGSGGLGTGEVIYGSNDLVFDPYTNTYRPYGEVFNDYLVRADEQIRDGKTSDEIREAVENYFDILYGGTKKDDK